MHGAHKPIPLFKSETFNINDLQFVIIESTDSPGLIWMKANSFNRYQMHYIIKIYYSEYSNGVEEHSAIVSSSSYDFRAIRHTKITGPNSIWPPTVPVLLNNS